jgi:hypothetical protein
MSFNHPIYDHCTYKRNLKENVSILSYVMSPFRYENQNKSRHRLGLVGGTAVSHIQGNLVDLESDLRGQTRYLTHCVNTQYKPVKPGEDIINDKTPPIDTRLKHLPTNQMIAYKSIPLPPSMDMPKCNH